MTKRRFTLDELPKHYREQAEAQINRNLNTNENANLESVACSKPMEKKEDKGHVTPCNIHVHSIRKRLADPDNISIKAVLDTIVRQGILRNDTAKDIKEIRYSQEKGKEEETIITLNYE